MPRSKPLHKGYTHLLEMQKNKSSRNMVHVRHVVRARQTDGACSDSSSAMQATSGQLGAERTMHVASCKGVRHCTPGALSVRMKHITEYVLRCHQAIQSA